MGFKRFFVGEPMPDKDDPKYKERYERDKAAGARFAQATGISWLAARVALWATEHKKAFLIITFGFVLGCFAFNALRAVIIFTQGKKAEPVRMQAVRGDSIPADNPYDMFNAPEGTQQTMPQ